MNLYDFEVNGCVDILLNFIFVNIWSFGYMVINVIS